MTPAKTTAEYDRQVAGRAVCFTAVLVAGRKRQRFEYPCHSAIGRYSAFLAANNKAKNLRDDFGRRGLVYAVDAAGRDVQLAEDIWPEIANLLRDAAQAEAKQ